LLIDVQPGLHFQPPFLKVIDLSTEVEYYWSVHSILLVTQNGICNMILIVHKGVGQPGRSTWTTSYPLRWIVKQRDK
jgi:hypothetical protein